MMDLITMAQEAAAHAPAAAAAAPVAAGVTGKITLAIAGAGSAIGVGMVGAKSVEAIGRNPGAFGNILVMGILGMALAEAIAIYALIFG